MTKDPQAETSQNRNGVSEKTLPLSNHTHPQWLLACSGMASCLAGCSDYHLGRLVPHQDIGQP